MPTQQLSNRLFRCLGCLQVRERLRAALERVATLEEQLASAHQQVRGGFGILPWGPRGLICYGHRAGPPCASWGAAAEKNTDAPPGLLGLARSSRHLIGQ